MTEAAAFQAEQEWLPEGLILHLKGETTAAAAGVFSVLLDLDPWPAAILLDFSAVDYINSTRIALLINLLR